MTTCSPPNEVDDLVCLECLLGDRLDGIDERGTLEIVEVTDAVG